MPLDPPQPSAGPNDLQTKIVGDMRQSVGVPARTPFVPGVPADPEVVTVAPADPRSDPMGIGIDAPGVGAIFDAIRANRGKA